MAKSNAHTGSRFDDFLKEEGIYDEVQAMNYAGAGQTALFLLVVSFLILSVVYALNRNLWAIWPMK